MNAFYNMPPSVLIEKQLSEIKVGDRIRLALGDVMIVSSITKGFYEGEYHLTTRPATLFGVNKQVCFNEPLSFDVEVY